MAAQHIGQYVSQDMALFDEAGGRLTVLQQLARDAFGVNGNFSKTAWLASPDPYA